MNKRVLEVNERVLKCVYVAVDEANEEREDLPPLAKSPDTPIQEAESGLDSLGLINFVVAVEEEVRKEFGTAIVLGDDRVLTMDPSPLRSVGSVAEYAQALIEEQRGG